MSIQALFQSLRLLVCIIPLTSSIAAAQIPANGRVPIHGVTGTLALPGDVDKFYSGMAKVVDGVAHVAHAGKGTPKDVPQTLADLQPGSSVTVHYIVNGIPASATQAEQTATTGASPNEGIVTRVDPGKNRITVRLIHGSTQTLRLAKHPNADLEGRSRVLVSHTDDSGHRVARYFKPVS